MYLFREKHKFATENSGKGHIEADKELLATYSPTSSLINRDPEGVLGKTLSFDLVYELLEHTSFENIISNRTSFKTKKARAAKKRPDKKESPPVVFNPIDNQGEAGTQSDQDGQHFPETSNSLYNQEESSAQPELEGEQSPAEESNLAPAENPEKKSS